MADIASARARRGIISRLATTPLGAVGLTVIALLTLAALLAPWLPLHDPAGIAMEHRLEPPGGEFLLGTDELGRDIFSRLVWGARGSLAIGLLTVAIGLVGGLALGIVAGYHAGTLVEDALLALIEIAAAIPLLVWAIAIVGIYGTGPVMLGPLTLPNEAKIVVLVGLLFVPGLARVAHGLAVVEAKTDYVAARQLRGAHGLAIMFGDILPNIISPVLVQASVLIGIGIIIEASLSFVGLGVQPPTPSWGGMLADAKTLAFADEWWVAVWPGVAIFVAVIGFNLVGDGLRTALDPRRMSHPS
jgi:peptide/nickel transport system permease protein